MKKSAFPLIAVAPDDYTAPGKPPGYDAASPRWRQFLEAAGCQVKEVDVRGPDILDQVAGCDGFMWRWAHFGGMRRIARRLLPVVEREMGIPVYPDQATCWHYDDKVAQALLFRALEIPSPVTRVFFRRDDALAWVREQTFPLVIKLAAGAGSRNVMLLRRREEAVREIERVFGKWTRALGSADRLSLLQRARHFVRQCVQGRPYLPHDDGFDLQSGYALFQEFLPGNAFDTRITVIGQRAFAYRRFNRPNDFRASGSGLLDHDPAAIDENFVRLAFSASQKLGMQSCAIDGLSRGSRAVLGEVSYTYISGFVRDCPGHWELDGDPEIGRLVWVDGHMWPEQAQVEDFLPRVLDRKRMTA